MNNRYKKTITACFVGYIVQAIVNNFVPLLFLTFSSAYDIPLSKITLLITVNFVIQLLIDVSSVTFVDRIGYRASMIIAHIMAALGLTALTFLPQLLPDAFAGLLIAVAIYAIGGGLLEVLVSPIVEACPTDNKEKAMSLLHSFYCWGQVGVVLLATIYFKLFGISNWRCLAVILAVIPIINAIVFIRVPIASLMDEGETSFSLKELFSHKIFWMLMIMMVCAGASELAVSQWASTFAEKGLGVSKATGDLAGPMAFAVLMGCARAFYGRFGDKINLNRFMIISTILCIASYLMIALIPVPALSLIGCGLTGMSVGIMWPGTFSKASASLRRGGTTMFALLALAGDLGCSGGPTLVGMVSSALNDNLNRGILVGTVFPVIMLIGLLVTSIKSNQKSPKRV